MNEAPKINRWPFYFFLLMILLLLLPKAGIDFIKSNHRIHVEKTRQENLQALIPLIQGNSIETKELTREVKLSQSILSTDKKIKKLTVIQLSFYMLVLIGLIRSRQANQM